MKFMLSLIAGSLLALNYVMAVIPPPRYNGGCQILSGHIYCFGGASSTTTPVTYYNDLYVLDLSQNIIDITEPNWVQLTSGFEVNSNFVMVPSSPTSFFIAGGTGSSNGKPLTHTFSSYNINTNNWTSYANSNASSSWVQTIGASGTPNDGYSYRPDHGLYLFGGQTDTTIGATNITYPPSIVALDMITGTWSAPLAAFSTVPPRIGHQLVYLNTHMVLVGGQIATSNGQGGYTLTPADMSVLPYFDTVDLSWHNSTISGTAPSPRSYFTLTPFRRYSSSAFLYGGIDANNQLCTDTMYILSMTGSIVNIWKQVPELASGRVSGPGPLFGHSTVAYNGNTMLIINGVDKTGQTTNSVRIYNVMSFAWYDSFDTNGIPPSSGSGNAVSVGSSGPSYMTFKSSQGVAGGVGASGLVLFGLIGFLLCRHVEKHQNLARSQEERMAAYGTKQEVVEEPLLEIRPTLHHGHYADQQRNLSATHVSSDHYPGL